MSMAREGIDSLTSPGELSVHLPTTGKAMLNTVKSPSNNFLNTFTGTFGVAVGSSYNNIDFIKVPENYKISKAASKISKVTLNAC